jgi:hypothetical protein
MCNADAKASGEGTEANEKEKLYEKKGVLKYA